MSHTPLDLDGCGSAPLEESGLVVAVAHLRFVRAQKDSAEGVVEVDEGSSEGSVSVKSEGVDPMLGWGESPFISSTVTVTVIARENRFVGCHMNYICL